MSDSVIQRAERMARSNPDRSRLYTYLRDECQDLLIAAADQGRVPPSAVSRQLVERFGGPMFHDRAMRQFCGLACAAILARAGFVVEKSNVRLTSDPLFSVGSTYRRPMPTANAIAPLLERLIASLTDSELREAEKLIRVRLRMANLAATSGNQKTGNVS